MERSYTYTMPLHKLGRKTRLEAVNHAHGRRLVANVFRDRKKWVLDGSRLGHVESRSTEGSRFEVREETR